MKVNGLPPTRPAARTASVRTTGPARTWVKRPFILEEFLCINKLQIATDKRSIRDAAKVLSTPQQYPIPLVNEARQLIGVLAISNNDPAKGFRLLDEAISSLGNTKTNTLVKLLSTRSMGLYFYGQNEKAVKSAQAAINLTKDPFELAWAYYWQAAAYKELGSFQQYADTLTTTYALFQQVKVGVPSGQTTYRIIELMADPRFILENSNFDWKTTSSDLLNWTDLTGSARLLVHLQRATIYYKKEQYQQALEELLKISQKVEVLPAQYLTQYLDLFFRIVGNSKIVDLNDAPSPVLQALRKLTSSKIKMNDEASAFAYLLIGLADNNNDKNNAATQSLRLARSFAPTCPLETQNSIHTLFVSCAIESFPPSDFLEDSKQIELAEEIMVSIEILMARQTTDMFFLHYKKAQIHLRLKEFEQAVADLNFVIENSATSKFYFYAALADRGTINLLTNKLDAALADLNQVINTQPDYLETGIKALQNRGLLYLCQGNVEAAKADLQFILDSELNVPSQRNMALALYMAGEHDKAAALWKGIKDNQDTNPYSESLGTYFPSLKKQFDDFMAYLASLDQKEPAEPVDLTPFMEKVRKAQDELATIPQLIIPSHIPERIKVNIGLYTERLQVLAKKLEQGQFNPEDQNKLTRLETLIEQLIDKL